MRAHLIHLTKADYVSTQWSGGTTTQIAIAPREARYEERTFLWRLSSAAVELEESVFTPLPNYNRLIAPLRGEMTLTHNGGAPIILRPYQVHAFDGGADTHCAGRCVDFNLMLRKGACEGRIFSVAGESGQIICLNSSLVGAELLLYCVKGGATVSLCEENKEINPEETAWASFSDDSRLKVKCKEVFVFMAAEIYRAKSV